MAWIKTMYGNVVVAPISQFACDAAEDIDNLPTNVVMGSKAVVIATGATYMMDSTGTWTLLEMWQPPEAEPSN